jgi:hypothetical protein
VAPDHIKQLRGANSMRAKDWAVTTERLEGHDEATKALALAVAGLIAIMLIPNLIMLLLY